MPSIPILMVASPALERSGLAPARGSVSGVAVIVIVAESDPAGAIAAVCAVVALHPAGTTALTANVDDAHWQLSLFCTVTV